MIDRSRSIMEINAQAAMEIIKKIGLLNIKDIIEENPDSPLLHNLVEAGYKTHMKVIVKAGYDIEKKNFMGLTAWQWATLNGQQSVARYLEKLGANTSVLSPVLRLNGDGVKTNGELLRSSQKFGASVEEKIAFERFYKLCLVNVEKDALNKEIIANNQIKEKFRL